MRPILFLTAAIAVFSACYMLSNKQTIELDEISVQKDFIDFITTYAKKYVDSAEFSRRY